MRCSLRPHRCFQPFQRERQMRAALGGDQRVDLIEDHRFNGAQHLARVRSQQQIDGFRRGDQNVGGTPGEARALGGRRIAGADGDRRLVELGRPGGARHLRDADQRRAKISFHVDRQGLDGRDVEHAAAFVARRHGREHQPVDAPEKGGESLAGAGGSEDQRGLAARDGRPAELLRPRRRRGTRPRTRRAQERGRGRAGISCRTGLLACLLREQLQRRARVGGILGPPVRH